MLPDKTTHPGLLMFPTISHIGYTSPLLPLNTHTPDWAVCTLYPHTTHDLDTLYSFLWANMGISCVLRPLSLIQASDRSHIIPFSSLTDLLSCGLPHVLPLLTMRSTALPHKMDARYNTHLPASSTQDYMRSPQSPYNKSPIGISPITHIVDLYLSFRFLALLRQR